MKVVLIKDVYKLGRAGEIKKVAAGYGRNYLIPQGLAIPASKGALQQAERIRVKATERRAALNEELSAVSEVLSGKTLAFPVKASETGRLYGSVSNDEIVKAIFANFQIELERRQVETEPIRQIGAYTIPIHLTMDLVPEITVIVHREGELPVPKTPTSEEEEVHGEAEPALEDEEEPVDLEEILPDEVEDEAEQSEA
ncbi:MAG TPA: 50S ribosomal protein L9 [Brevefilum sp.]|nr:50S ribosomal protein L9 [Brevefilum sp.]HOR18845.1 50S ribosomal protein L9 [Brevefilum sp.]HPL69691.1 50S ribosomal protein L9 [Brevefilum sp.]